MAFDMTSATQFANGGFMSSHDDGMAGQGKAINTSAPETMRSLTVAQIRKATQDLTEFTYDGNLIKNVSMVAVITAKQVTETFLVLTVYDGTGSIRVKQCLDGDDSQNQATADALMEGRYIRIYGGLRDETENGRNELQIFAFNTRPIDDHNEVAFHNLDVIFQHLVLTQGQNGSGSANMANMGGMPASGTAYARSNGGAPMQPLQNSGMGAVRPGDCASAVVSYLSSDAVANTEHGAHISQIIQALSGQYSESEVRQAVDYASGQGHCYTTADESTFKTV